MKKIADGLYQAASFDSQCEAKAAGVTLIVDMAGLLPPQPEVVSCPIADDANGCTYFESVWQLAQALAQRKETILTLCQMGENRSGLMSALILVARGMSPKEAVALVQANGPHNSPTQPHSFWNPGFVRQVLALDYTNNS